MNRLTQAWLGRRRERKREKRFNGKNHVVVCDEEREKERKKEISDGLCRRSLFTQLDSSFLQDNREAVLFSFFLSLNQLILFLSFFLSFHSFLHLLLLPHLSYLSLHSFPFHLLVLPLSLPFFLSLPPLVLSFIHLIHSRLHLLLIQSSFILSFSSSFLHSFLPSVALQSSSSFPC